MLDPLSQVVDRINHLILPVFVLGISGTASLMRLMRSQILEIKNSEFVRTARAKGLSERVVIYKHVLRNALNPFVTMAGYSLGDLLGGAALVEAVMNLQGLGLLMPDAVRSLDIYLVMGSVLMGTILLLVGNLLADIALVAVDPRVDFSSVTAEGDERDWRGECESPGRCGIRTTSVGRCPRMAPGIADGPLFRELPRAVLPARRRVAVLRQLRSDLSEPRDARLSSDGAAHARAVGLVARSVLHLPDAHAG